MPWLLAFLLALFFVSKRFPQHSFLPHSSELAQLITALIIGYVVAGLIVSALKFGLRVPRPSALYGQGVVHSWESVDSPFSLPSGHSAFAILVAATFWRSFSYAMRFALSIVVLWVGFSRINLGMHFPSDVILGYIAGLFGWWCADRVLTRRSSGPPPAAA